VLKYSTAHILFYSCIYVYMRQRDIYYHQNSCTYMAYILKNVCTECDYVTYLKYRDLCLMYLSTSAGICNIVSFSDSLCHVSFTAKLATILSHETHKRFHRLYYVFNKNITHVSLK